MCYLDKIGPYNMDYNYRDAIRTSVTEKTQNLWINVEGIYDITRDQVEKTLLSALKLITKFCGGEVEEIGIIE